MKKLFLISFIFIFLLSFGSAIPTDGLIGYFPMNETGTNTTILDYSPWGEHLTAYGSPNLDVEGIRETGAYFDGGVAMNNTAYTELQNIDTGNLSVSFWFNSSTSTSTEGLVTYRRSGVGGYWDVMMVANGTVRWHTNIPGEANVYSTTDLDDGVLHHIVAIRNCPTGDLYLYVDGVLDVTGSGIDDCSSLSATTYFSIGEFQPGTNRLQDGLIDEVRLYNTTLTSSDVSDLYSQGTTTIYSPVDNSIYANASSVFFNWTSNAVSGSLVNTSIYINGSLLTTIPITGSTNSTTYSKVFYLGEYNFTIETCDNSCYNSSQQSFSVTRIKENAVTYAPLISEGTPTNFILNISNGGSVISSVLFNYSGTTSAISAVDFTNYLTLTKTLTTPLVSGSEVKKFNWIITLDDGYVYNSTLYSQTVSDILLDNCSTYTNPLYNFTIVGEESQALINGVTGNTYSEVDFDLKLEDGSSLVTYSTSFNQTNPFAICISNNLSGTTEGLYLDAQVQYRSDSHVVEFYNIQNELITSDDLGTNVTLYDLLSADAQEFLIVYTDQYFNPVKDALILVKRKYISEGVFKTVEVPLTNIDGEAIANLVLSDVIYSFTVMKEGSLLATFDNQIAFCDNVATGDCIIRLNTYSTTSLPSTFSDVGGYYFNIDYNSTSRVLSSSFAVSSGDTATNTLNVTLLSNQGVIDVCQDTLISASGTLSCTIPSQYENSTVIAILNKDGLQQGKAVISLGADPDEIYGNSRIFLAIALFLMVIGIGVVDSPAMMGILMILGSILLVAFNLINSGPGSGFIGASATVLWFIITIIVILVKGARR